MKSKYYVRKKDGRLEIIPEIQGKPVDIDSFDVIELPYNRGNLKVKGKEYPDYKVVGALYLGQIKIEEIETV